MAKNMNAAGTLQVNDTIEVPVEACRIVSVQYVPGQLKDRRSRLLKFKVSPLTGPWANCEGEFILESGDLVPVVKRYTASERRRAALKNFVTRIIEKLRGTRIEEVKSLPNLTGPMT